MTDDRGPDAPGPSPARAPDGGVDLAAALRAAGFDPQRAVDEIVAACLPEPARGVRRGLADDEVRARARALGMRDWCETEQRALQTALRCIRDVLNAPAEEPYLLGRAERLLAALAEEPPQPPLDAWRALVGADARIPRPGANQALEEALGVRLLALEPQSTDASALAEVLDVDRPDCQTTLNLALLERASRVVDTVNGGRGGDLSVRFAAHPGWPALVYRGGGRYGVVLAPLLKEPEPRPPASDPAAPTAG